MAEADPQETPAEVAAGDIELLPEFSLPDEASAPGRKGPARPLAPMQPLHPQAARLAAAGSGAQGRRTGCAGVAAV